MIISDLGINPGFGHAGLMPLPTTNIAAIA